VSVANYQAQVPEVQVGPTSTGLVRVYVMSERIQVPLDFTPEEAEALADRIRAAATQARVAPAATGRGAA
jgi:hypothetical protein